MRGGCVRGIGTSEPMGTMVGGHEGVSKVASMRVEMESWWMKMRL
jgi:hypothetical protein